MPVYAIEHVGGLVGKTCKCAGPPPRPWVNFTGQPELLYLLLGRAHRGAIARARLPQPSERVRRCG